MRGLTAEPEQVRHGPAIQVILAKALVGERLVAFELAGGRLAEKELDASVLMIARVVALVELMPAAELGADRVPEQLHDLDPFDGVDPVRAADVPVQVAADLRVLKVAAT